MNARDVHRMATEKPVTMSADLLRVLDRAAQRDAEERVPRLCVEDYDLRGRMRFSERMQEPIQGGQARRVCP
jgi:hypothetical protein